MRSTIRLTITLALAVAATAAGQSTTPMLTLEEAITLALRNNAEYLRAQTTRDRNGVTLRGAYGQLLPSISSGFGAQFREGRQDLVQGVSFGATSDQISSSASVSLSLGVSMERFLAPRRARADLDASEQSVFAAEHTVRNQVTTAYFNALQAQAQALLQDTILASVEAQLEIARAVWHPFRHTGRRPQQ